MNFSSSIKEKNLCDPLKAMSYIKASNYFYQDPIFLDIEIAQIFKNFSKEENSNYNLASLICQLPKRKLINDADLLSKQINVSFLSNYVSLKFNLIFKYF